jgi:diguanylate cyclase (GGDEF)-like protein
MRVLIRIVCSVIVIVALFAIVRWKDDLEAVFPSAPEAATIAIASLVALLFLVGRQRQLRDNEASVLALSNTSPEPSPAPTPAHDIVHDRALVTFARQLVAATATAELRATIESQLPALVEGRRVWVVAEKGADAATKETNSHLGQFPLLTDDLQEWTTFILQVDGTRYGLLGVESPGGLSPQIKQRLQSVTPLISQALKTAQDVDGFREASVVDLLTSTATRREGLNRLQAEVKRAQRTGSAMAVLMLDLDHFKGINDRFGHALGDTLLTAIGQTLTRTLRATDVRCRWGGEEFLIVLPDTSLAQAQVVATHLLQNLAATVVPSPQGNVSSTASIGLTVSRPAETDVQRIVVRADKALYQAKNAGRACIRVVLGDFDGEPIGVETPRQATSGAAEKLPFADRRSATRPDRRGLPGHGRRRTDALTVVQEGREVDQLFTSSERKLANA